MNLHFQKCSSVFLPEAILMRSIFHNGKLWRFHEGCLQRFCRDFNLTSVRLELVP